MTKNIINRDFSIYTSINREKKFEEAKNLVEKKVSQIIDKTNKLREDALIELLAQIVAEGDIVVCSPVALGDSQNDYFVFRPKRSEYLVVVPKVQLKV